MAGEELAGGAELVEVMCSIRSIVRKVLPSGAKPLIVGYRRGVWEGGDSSSPYLRG